MELGDGGSWGSALLPIIKTILDWVSLTSIRNAIILWGKFLESSNLISAWGEDGGGCQFGCFEDKLTTHLIGSVIISNISNFLSLHLNIHWTIPTIVIQLSSNKNPTSLPLQQPLAQTVKSFQHFLLLLSLPQSAGPFRFSFRVSPNARCLVNSPSLLLTTFSFIFSQQCQVN